MNWTSGARPMGSCGLPLPGLATRIVNPVTLEDGTDRSEGELIVRGPNLMHGYHNKPAETPPRHCEKSGITTGDLAKSDSNGYLTITRAHQGTDHQRRTKPRAGRNRGSRDSPCRGRRLRGRSACPHATLGRSALSVCRRRTGQLDVEALLAHCRRACRPTKFLRRPILFRKFLAPDPERSCGSACGSAEKQLSSRCRRISRRAAVLTVIM